MTPDHWADDAPIEDEGYGDEDPETIEDLIYQRDCYRDQAGALAGQLAALRAGNFEVCEGRDGRMAAARFAWDGDDGEPMGGPALVVGFDDGGYLDVTYRGFLVASFNFDTQAHDGGEVVDVSVGTAEDVTCQSQGGREGGWVNATVDVAPGLAAEGRARTRELLALALDPEAFWMGEVAP